MDQHTQLKSLLLWGSGQISFLRIQFHFNVSGLDALYG